MAAPPTTAPRWCCVWKNGEGDFQDADPGRETPPVGGPHRVPSSAGDEVKSGSALSGGMRAGKDPPQNGRGGFFARNGTRSVPHPFVSEGPGAFCDSLKRHGGSSAACFCNRTPAFSCRLAAMRGPRAASALEFREANCNGSFVPRGVCSKKSSVRSVDSRRVSFYNQYVDIRYKEGGRWRARSWRR